MDVYEILKDSFGKSKNNLDLLSHFANGLNNAFPGEASAIETWRDDLRDRDGADHPTRGDAPFAWIGRHQISEEKPVKDFFDLVLAAQQQFFTTENYRLLMQHAEQKEQQQNETTRTNQAERLTSPLLSEFTILVYKYSQSTGAHLNIKRLETMFENLAILDVKDLSATSALDGCAGRPYILINTIQPVTLWPEFESFVKKAKEKNITIVYYFHEGDDIISRFANEQSSALSAFRDTLPRAHFLSLTKEQELVLQKYFPEIPSNRFHFQGNVLSYDDYNFPTRAPNESQRFMVVIGSIQPRKGIDFVKRLTAAVAKINPDMHVLWLGLPNRYDPSYWRDVPKNLHFMGNIFGSARKVICAKADALLMPSEVEPFSFSVAEAVIAGIPIVYRPGRCGLLEQVDAINTAPDSAHCIEEITDESIFSLLQFLDCSRLNTTNNLAAKVEEIMEPNRYAHRIRRNLVHVLNATAAYEATGKSSPKLSSTDHLSGDGYDQEKSTGKWRKVFERNR